MELKKLNGLLKSVCFRGLWTLFGVLFLSGCLFGKSNSERNNYSDTLLVSTVVARPPIVAQGPTQVKTQVKTQAQSMPSQAGVLKTLWDGTGSEYCRLSFNEFLKQGLMIPSVGKTGLSDLVIELEKENRLQEALWAYQILGNSQKREEMREKIVEALSSDPTENLHFWPGGSVPKELLKFSGGVLALFKPEPMVHIWANSTSEVAAYRLDQILGTNIVPVTLHRSLKLPDGTIQAGSLQYWLTESVRQGLTSDIQKRGFIPMKVLDYLIGNLDRQIANFLSLNVLSRVVAIDNGYSFLPESCGTESDIVKYLDLDKRLRRRIQSLNEDELKEGFKDILSSEQEMRLVARIQGLKERLLVVEEE